jgi:hypothetical protein
MIALNAGEREAFDSPPVFNSFQRKQYFDFPSKLRRFAAGLRRALKAEALHLGGRTYEALEVVREAEALVERSGERSWCAELHRLRGVFLTAIGADETQI